MRIYNHTHDTQEYIGWSEARMDPIDGNPMIPAYATTQEPPQKKEGYAIVYIDGVWEHIEDHRGETSFSVTDPIRQETIEYLGAVRDGWTTQEPPYAFSVWDTVSGMWVEDIEAKKSHAYTVLSGVCDEKSREAKNYIAGQNVSDEQLRRYEEKYAVAKEYKASGAYADTLALEANIKGMTIDQLADAIIAAGDAYKAALIGYNAMIEAFRVKVKSMIDAGEIDAALELIELAKQLDATTTASDIEQMFSAGA